mgnify:CR=1 FL=1
MSSDFDFGEFLDESNQSELMILCLDLFGVLSKFQVDHNKLETAKVEILNNQITKNFEGFRSAISNLSGGDKSSQINSMKHINLMVDTLVGDSKSTEKFTNFNISADARIRHATSAFSICRPCTCSTEREVSFGKIYTVSRLGKF